MRLTKSSKGQMRVIEVILSALVIVSAITFVNIFAILPSSPKYEISDLEKMGHNVLHDLDEQRLLGRFVYNETEWGELTLALMIYLSPDVYFDLAIYDSQGILINQDFAIRYGAPSEVFADSDSIASVSYIIPGLQTEYNPRILILQLVRG